MSKPTDVCLNCGYTREEIKRKELYCGINDYWGEAMAEFPRHEYKMTKARQRREAEQEAAIAQYYEEFVNSILYGGDKG